MAVIGRAAGRHLYAVAHNRVVRPVRSGRGRRSLGSQRALGWPGTPPGELEPVLAALVDRVTRRTRRAGLAGRTVVLRLRFDDSTRATRSRTMHRATASTEPVLATARTLLAAAQPFIDGRPLTLLGLTLTNLERDRGQLTLALERRDHAALDGALDEIRDRFGPGTVSRAAYVDSDDSLAAFLIPATARRPGPAWVRGPGRARSVTRWQRIPRALQPGGGSPARRAWRRHGSGWRRRGRATARRRADTRSGALARSMWAAS